MKTVLCVSRRCGLAIWLPFFLFGGCSLPGFWLQRVCASVERNTHSGWLEATKKKKLRTSWAMPSRSIWCVCPSYCRFHHVRGVSSVVSLAVLISTSNRLGFGVSMIHLLLLLCNPYIISRVWLFVNFHCVRNGQRERKKREHKFEASHAAPHFGFIDNSREIKRKKKENNFFFPIWRNRNRFAVARATQQANEMKAIPFTDEASIWFLFGVFNCPNTDGHKGTERDVTSSVKSRLLPPLVKDGLINNSPSRFLSRSIRPGGFVANSITAGRTRGDQSECLGIDQVGLQWAKRWQWGRRASGWRTTIRRKKEKGNKGHKRKAKERKLVFFFFFFFFYDVLFPPLAVVVVFPPACVRTYISVRFTSHWLSRHQKSSLSTPPRSTFSRRVQPISPRALIPDPF